MNRRALLAGIAAAALPKPEFATGGFVKPGHYIVGERCNDIGDVFRMPHLVLRNVANRPMTATIQIIYREG